MIRPQSIKSEMQKGVWTRVDMHLPAAATEENRPAGWLAAWCPRKTVDDDTSLFSLVVVALPELQPRVRHNTATNSQQSRSPLSDVSPSSVLPVRRNLTIHGPPACWVGVMASCNRLTVSPVPRWRGIHHHDQVPPPASHLPGACLMLPSVLLLMRVPKLPVGGASLA